MKEGVCAYCCTYNHKNYIIQALEGFVNQVVDFPYKVIVHDDASTDGTAEIVKEYADKYPEIIIPILQRENQYSKKEDIFYKYIAPYIDYKYLAICEGDDCWNDKEKIKKQYKYMINNPDVSLCVHNTMRISQFGEELGVVSPYNEDTDVSVEDIIKSGGGGLFHTSSYFLKSELKLKYPNDLRIPHIGDYPLAIYAAINGRVHYNNKVMSCYRINVDGSFSKRIVESDESMINYCSNMIKYLDDLDEYTNYKYQSACEGQRYHFEKEILLRTSTFINLFTQEKARNVCKKSSLRTRMHIYKRVLSKDIKKLFCSGG